MPQTCRNLFSVLILALAMTANGQNSASVEPPHALKYENSPNLPNGVAFFMMLIELDHMNTRFGPADAAAWVSQELKLNNADSHNFVSEALTMRYLIHTEFTTQKDRHACEFAGPEVERKEKYAALRRIDDIRKAIYDHYYDQTKANLSQDTGELFQRWINDTKLNSVYYEGVSEEADQRSGRNSTVNLSKWCERAN